MTMQSEAQWTSLQDAGLNFGDEFTYHGMTRNKFQSLGVRVRIERYKDTTGVLLIDVASGVQVSQCTGLRRAKWWVVL